MGGTQSAMLNTPSEKSGATSGAEMGSAQNQTRTGFSPRSARQNTPFGRHAPPSVLPKDFAMRAGDAMENDRLAQAVVKTGGFDGIKRDLEGAIRHDGQRAALEIVDLAQRVRRHAIDSDLPDQFDREVFNIASKIDTEGSTGFAHNMRNLRGVSPSGSALAENILGRDRALADTAVSSRNAKAAARKTAPARPARDPRDMPPTTGQSSGQTSGQSSGQTSGQNTQAQTGTQRPPRDPRDLPPGTSMGGKPTGGIPPQPPRPPRDPRDLPPGSPTSSGDQDEQLYPQTGGQPGIGHNSGSNSEGTQVAVAPLAALIAAGFTPEAAASIAALLTAGTGAAVLSSNDTDIEFPKSTVPPLGSPPPSTVPEFKPPLTFPAHRTDKDKKKDKNESKKPADSSKNEKHGAGGSALEKAQPQIDALNEQARNAPNKKMRVDLRRKARKIKEMAQKDDKGTEHSLKKKQ